jgi:hypothetical protein
MEIAGISIKSVGSWRVKSENLKIFYSFCRNNLAEKAQIKSAFFRIKRADCSNCSSSENRYKEP